MDAVAVVLSVLLTALAGWQITEVVHHGSAFARPRAWAEANLEHHDDWIRWPAQLLACPFCFSHWACAFVTLSCLRLLCSTPLEGLLWSVPIWLAGTRLANLGNDVAYSFTRMHKPSETHEHLPSENDSTDFELRDPAEQGPQAGSF